MSGSSSTPPKNIFSAKHRDRSLAPSNQEITALKTPQVGLINFGCGRFIFDVVLVSPKYKKDNPKDIVILCGSPGAGKSTFYWKQLEPLGYSRVNQDILKTVRAAFASDYRTQANVQEA